MAEANSDELAQQTIYSSKESIGVTILVVISAFSLVSVIYLLLILAVSLLKFKKKSEYPAILNGHVAAYFMSMLLSTGVLAVGYLSSVQWVSSGSVQPGTFCSVQGTIIQVGQVGVSIWSSILAFYSFKHLVLKWDDHVIVLWITFLIGWLGTIASVLVGPTVISNVDDGPFYSVSEYWCWISPNYHTSQLVLGYLFFIITFVQGFILVLTVFIRKRKRFWSIDSDERNNEPKDKPQWNRALTAKQSALFSAVYIVLVIPTTITGLIDWAGVDVAFEVTIFSTVSLALIGFVNGFLYTIIRYLLWPQTPPKSHVPRLSIDTFDFRDSNRSSQALPPYEPNEPAPMLVRSPSYESDLRTVRSVPLWQTDPPPLPTEVPYDVENGRDSFDSIYTEVFASPFKQIATPRQAIPTSVTRELFTGSMSEWNERKGVRGD